MPPVRARLRNSSLCSAVSGTMSSRTYVRRPGTVRTGLAPDSRVRPSIPGTSYQEPVTIGRVVSTWLRRGKLCSSVAASWSSLTFSVVAR